MFHLEPEDKVSVCDSQLSMNISSQSAILTITSIIMLSVSNALMKGVMPGALKYPGRTSLLHQRGYLCQTFVQLENTNKPGSNDKKSHGRSTRQSFATKLVAGETLLMQTYLLRALVRYLIGTMHRLDDLLQQLGATMFTIAGTQLNAQCDSIKEAAGSPKGSNEILMLHLFDPNTFDNSSLVLNLILRNE